LQLPAKYLAELPHSRTHPDLLDQTERVIPADQSLMTPLKIIGQYLKPVIDRVGSDNLGRPALRQPRI